MKKIYYAVATLYCLVMTPAFAENMRIIGSVGYQAGPDDPEAYVRVIGEPYFWKLQPTVGLSAAKNGSAWAGIGSAVTLRFYDDSMFVRFGTMAGLYRSGSGRDLSGPIQFRSNLDIGFSQRNGFEFGIGADHRSSAGIYTPNPGLDTVYLFASFPLR
jgi:hypothetical protein